MNVYFTPERVKEEIIHISICLHHDGLILHYFFSAHYKSIRAEQLNKIDTGRKFY